MTHSPLQQRLARVVDVVFSGSVHAAALAAGVEPSTLHRLVEGAVGNPRLATLRTLADSFGLPVSWISGELTTAQTQGPDQPAQSESEWLLTAFNRARQKRARDKLLYSPLQTPLQTWIGETFRSYNLNPATPQFPLADVQKLMQAMPEDSPIRIDINRKFQQLEFDLVEAAAAMMSSFSTASTEIYDEQ